MLTSGRTGRVSSRGVSSTLGFGRVAGSATLGLLGRAGSLGRMIVAGALEG